MTDITDMNVSSAGKPESSAAPLKTEPEKGTLIEPSTGTTREISHTIVPQDTAAKANDTAIPVFNSESLATPLKTESEREISHTVVPQDTAAKANDTAITALNAESNPIVNGQKPTEGITLGQSGANKLSSEQRKSLEKPQPDSSQKLTEQVLGKFENLGINSINLREEVGELTKDEEMHLLKYFMRDEFRIAKEARRREIAILEEQGGKIPEDMQEPEEVSFEYKGEGPEITGFQNGTVIFVSDERLRNQDVIELARQRLPENKVTMIIDAVKQGNVKWISKTKNNEIKEKAKEYVANFLNDLKRKMEEGLKQKKEENQPAGTEERVATRSVNQPGKDSKEIKEKPIEQKGIKETIKKTIVIEEMEEKHAKRRREREKEEELAKESDEIRREAWKKEDLKRDINKEEIKEK